VDIRKERGVYQPLPNFVVHTGRAGYGAPELAGIVAIDAEEVSVRIAADSTVRQGW
jgi:hypothetical protein